jgi:hypothetical protein
LLLQAQRKAGTALVQFTIEFFRIRVSDGAHATLARISQDVPDLEAAKVRANISVREPQYAANARRLANSE